MNNLKLGDLDNPRNVKAVKDFMREHNVAELYLHRGRDIQYALCSLGNAVASVRREARSCAPSALSEESKCEMRGCHKPIAVLKIHNLQA